MIGPEGNPTTVKTEEVTQRLIVLRPMQLPVEATTVSFDIAESESFELDESTIFLSQINEDRSVQLTITSNGPEDKVKVCDNIIHYDETEQIALREVDFQLKKAIFCVVLGKGVNVEQAALVGSL